MQKGAKLVIKFCDYKLSLILGLAVYLLTLGLSPAQALTTAEPAGLGTLILETEASQQMIDPKVRLIIGRFSYGISQQLDIRVLMGLHSRSDYNSGFLFGGGLKWMIEMETESFPGISLVLEVQRANFGVNYTSNGLTRSGWEEVFNASGYLIASKRFGQFMPYFVLGVNSFDLELVDASTNQPVAGKSGHSAGVFSGLGLSYELMRSMTVLLQIDYDSAGPLGAKGFTGKAGLNIAL